MDIKALWLDWLENVYVGLFANKTFILPLKIAAFILKRKKKIMARLNTN